jgi:hypothetical protein
VLCGVSIPSEDGSKDELWILADLAGQKCVLKLADWWDEDGDQELADACFVDYAVHYDGTALRARRSARPQADVHERPVAP